MEFSRNGIIIIYLRAYYTRTHAYKNYSRFIDRVIIDGLNIFWSITINVSIFLSRIANKLIDT